MLVVAATSCTQGIKLISAITFTVIINKTAILFASESQILEVHP